MKNKKSIGWVELVLGVVMVILGIYTLSKPSIALGGMVVTFGVLAIACGIGGIVFYIQLEKRTGFGPASAMVSGILSILAGVLLLFNVQIGTWVFTILFPFWFIVQCVSNLGNLAVTRLFYGDGIFWTSLVTGVLGLFLGLALLLNPFVSYFTAGSLIAVYILMTGVASIARGCRLISLKS